MKIIRSRNIILLLLLLVYNVICIIQSPLRKCNESDFGTAYTPCRGNIRYAVYYKKTSCQDGFEPPLPAELKCDILCPSGTFLAPPATECVPCPAGKFSFSEGTRYDSWFNTSTLMSHFRTECSSQSGSCSPWRLRGSYIDSGDQKGEDLVQSKLILPVNIIRDYGSVSYSFKVDAERGDDGLEFYVDNRLVQELVSYTYGFLAFTVPLTKGFHTLEWRYVKDEMGTRGRDKAFIKFIEINGTKKYDEECSPCPPGTFSNEGQSKCSPCPMNTYSDTYGMSKCKECEEGYYSEPGATKCTKKPLCTTKDYTSYYTECENNKRTLKYDWIKPKICDGGVELPEEKPNQECAKCPKGMYRDSTSKCVPCENGSYYNETSKRCEACPKGSAAIKFLRYEGFSEYKSALPSGWETKCLGICSKQNMGWRVNKDGYLDSSEDGFGQQIIFSFKSKFYTRGRVIFHYEIYNNDDEESAYLTFSIDNSSHFIYKQFTENVSIGTFVSDYYPKGEHEIVFSFENDASYDAGAKAIIKSIIIEGDEKGGVDRCIDCPEGYKCPPNADQFTPCPPGKSSELKSDTCTPCPANTYSANEGSKCLPCGEGTTSKPNSVECDNTCEFSIPNSNIRYNIKSLDKGLYTVNIGPINSTEKIYINVCSKLKTNDQVCKIKSSKGTYACFDYKTGAYDLGNLVAYKSLPGDQKNKGFLLEYSNGKECYHNFPLKTIIHFICDVDAGAGQPELDQPGGLMFYNLCDVSPIKIKWRSSFACPICTADDIAFDSGKCSNNIRRTSWYFKPESKCNREGVKLPPGEEIPCQACKKTDITLIEGKCENGTRKMVYAWKEPKICEGGELPAPYGVACSELSVPKVTAIILGSIAGVVLFILTTGLVVMYYKHRKLYRDYTLLTNKDAMKDISLTEDSESDDDTDDEQQS